MKWIFNSLMLYGLVFGWLILNSLGNIRDAWKHPGPGDMGFGEWTMNVFLLSLGVWGWITIARLAKKEKKSDLGTFT